VRQRRINIGNERGDGGPIAEVGVACHEHIHSCEDRSLGGVSHRGRYTDGRFFRVRRERRRARGTCIIVIDLTFLGTGTSTGVPVIGCDCATCTSAEPRDQRLRASVHLAVDGQSILVDTSPDMRTQMLRAKIRHIDAVLYTHMHADHTAGLDELRRYNALQQARIPAYADASTAAELVERFGYAFGDPFSWFGGKPDLDLTVFDGPFTVGGITVTPVPVMHGTLPIVGFRIGTLAYLTDAKTIPASSMALLQDLDTLVITALRPNDHPAHMSLGEALATIEILRPKRAFLSHLGHEMGPYAEVEPLLPEHVRLATDNLRIAIR
jgi:phosphoribosyl 1,2-cyclic phosphate phosphodiesterase